MRSSPGIIHCSLPILNRFPLLGKRKKPTDRAGGSVYLPRNLSPTTVLEEMIMREGVAQGTLVHRVRTGLEMAAGMEEAVIDEAGLLHRDYNPQLLESHGTMVERVSKRRTLAFPCHP
jgi:hypothetical protein